MRKEYFDTALANNVFQGKYQLEIGEDWGQRAETIVEDVAGTQFGTSHAIMSEEERKFLAKMIAELKFIPGGRYVYYGGRKARFWNNCYTLRGEVDTREEWAALAQRATSCLMTGGGIGVDYSRFRPSGKLLNRTGGQSSGPLPLMEVVNEIGRNVMQGGSRRSAIYGSLNWQHEDVSDFLKVKNWDETFVHEGYTLFDAKQENFDFPAPLDMTNISLNYDNAFLEKVDPIKTETKWTNPSEFPTLNVGELPTTFIENCKQALRTGEPGFSFNFYEQENETLRNACCELVSEDDSDVCNLGSVNIGRIESAEEFRQIVNVASKFLICGTIRAELPYQKVYDVREKNRRIGLGLMGVHEWLLKRGYDYEVPKELHQWLKIYEEESVSAADDHCDRLFINRPVAYRAIAPTGSIGILASTTTGIEPLYSVAYKRRYLVGGNKWKYEYCVDHTADQLINKYGIDPEKIETANSLAKDPERRIKFQADIQDYVDNAISSTINLPAWGTQHNNESNVISFATALAKYSHRLRGFTCYPDGARGGQPITEVPYEEALKHKNVVYEENDDVCKGGVCGV